MKKLVSIFIMAVSLLALAPSFVWSQTGATQVYERGINIPDNNHVDGLTVTKHGDYAISFLDYHATDNQNISLFNQEGGVTWHNTSITPEYTIVDIIDMNGQDGLLAVVVDELVRYDYSGAIVDKIKIAHRHVSGLSLYKDLERYYVVEGNNNITQADIAVYDNALNFVRSFPVLGGVTGIVGRDGYLYISSTGYGGGIISNGSSDLSKYDLSGNLVWTKHFPDRIGSNIVSVGDDLYMANVSLVNDSLSDQRWEVIKADTSGSIIWQKEWTGDYPEGPGKSPDLTLWIYDLVDLPTGGCVVVGSATKLTQADNPIDPNKVNPMAIAFNSEGDIAWKIRIDKEGINYGQFRRAIWDNDHYLVMVGENQDTSKLLWKYSVDGVTAVEQEGSSLPSEFRLDQNYPNPFNPTTTIEFSIVKEGKTSLKVYDILGKEVATLVDEELTAGNYSAKFDAGNLSSGIYVYVLKTPNYTASKKMILLK